MSAADAAIQKKLFGSGMTALTVSNKEMDDIVKIVKSLEELGWLTKGVSEAIEYNVKGKKWCISWLVIRYIEF